MEVEVIHGDYPTCPSQKEEKIQVWIGNISYYGR